MNCNNNTLMLMCLSSNLYLQMLSTWILPIILLAATYPVCAYTSHEVPYHTHCGIIFSANLPCISWMETIAQRGWVSWHYHAIHQQWQYLCANHLLLHKLTTFTIIFKTSSPCFASHTCPRVQINCLIIFSLSNIFIKKTFNCHKM